MQSGRVQPLPRSWAPFHSLRFALPVALAIGLLGIPVLFGQQSSDSQADSSPAPTQPAPPKQPTLMDPAGPEFSLQDSEALFDIAAALNSCGYDEGLAASDPVRLAIRDDINTALRASAQARDAHDKLCDFIIRHNLSDSGLNLAQYISLALYISPPPELSPTVDNADMPPDSTQVVDVLPLLRNFSDLVSLHLIWLNHRPQYDHALAELHDSLTKMIVETNVYLKTPASTLAGERFLVVVEPLLDPEQTNARVYGSDYVVVVSPVNGTIHMSQVRHTYLHYEIEPLMYARATAIDRLLPFLKIIRDAPLDYTYRSDVVSLVIECMIKAIEARTMDTGVTIYNVPNDVRRSDLEGATRQHNASMAAAEAVRRDAVQKALLQGFVLTPYFYSQFVTFEKQPQSLEESIGEMVYGMQVESEIDRVKHIQFVDQAPSDVVTREPKQLKGLDLAESDLMKGNTDEAGKAAQKVLDDRVGDAGHANFILARVAIMHGDVTASQHSFQEAIRLSKDPRMLAWSHIYLGRIYDIQNQRDQAVTEYRAALTVRDGQADTKSAAEKGLKEAYTVPQVTHTEPASDDSSTPDPATPEQTTAPDEKAPEKPNQPR